MYLHHPQTLRGTRDRRVRRARRAPGRQRRVLVPHRLPERSRDSTRTWAAGRSGTSAATRSAWRGGSPARSRTRSHGFARFDERGVDRTFVGQLRFPSGLLAQFESGFAAADRERIEIVGSDATLDPGAPVPARAGRTAGGRDDPSRRHDRADRRAVRRRLPPGGGRPPGRDPRRDDRPGSTLDFTRGQIATLERAGSGRPRRARSRLTRRRRSVAAGLLVGAAVVAVVAVAFVTVGPLRTPARPGRAALRRRDAAASGIAHDLRRRPRSTRPAAASRSSTATTTAGRTCSSPAGRTPRVCSATGADRRSAAVHDGTLPRRRIGPASPAPIRSTSTATVMPTSRFSGSTASSSCAEHGDADSRTHGAGLGFDGGTGWTTAFSATWEGTDAAADDGARPVPDPRCRPAPRPSTATTNALVRPAGAPATGYAPPLTLVPGLVQPLDAVQRLGRFRAARPARLATTASTTRRRRGAALAGRARARRRARTRPPTAGVRSRSGAWGSPATT